MYNEGDRLGVWRVGAVHYRGEQFGYVYELLRFEKTKKLSCTCTEKVLVQMFSEVTVN